MKINIKIYFNLNSIAGNFKGILLDAYGVFWGGNGIGVLPGCKEAMEALVSSGKIVGILSNISQLVPKEIEKLKEHGLIQGKHFHFFITSGEIAKNAFSQNELPFPTLKKKFISFGEAHPRFSSHLALFSHSVFEETQEITEADFIYLSIPHLHGEDQTDPEIFMKKIQALSHHKLPMVCTNPDHFAHEGSPPKTVVRQGAIAHLYEKIGGTVIYLGKPSEKMFTAAMKSFYDYGLIDLKDILMVGDTPETDIRGANNFGMSSALVTKTGIMAERLSKNSLNDLIKTFPTNDLPTFFIEGLA